MEILSPQSLHFPPLEQADEEGLLAVGGDLHPARLVAAYSKGIFPWYDESESPVLWWSPDPRFVLVPQEVRISKTMRQVLRREDFTITTNQAFPEVMTACAVQKRPGQAGTWIGREMLKAYAKLHKMGLAISVEAWRNGLLAGGLYGVRLGNVFFGESMFAKTSNASKAAFITYCNQLVKEGVTLIDCQTYTAHLESLGAGMMDRAVFAQHLQKQIAQEEVNRLILQAIESEHRY